MRSTALLALVILVAGCALDRRGIGSGGQLDARIDPHDGGGTIEDAWVPPVDAPIEEPSGGPPDSGPLDAGIPCGDGGQVCCDTAPACGAGLACADSACVVCGSVEQPCCDGVCIDGSSCEGDVCVAPCGSPGQPCCPDFRGCDAPGAYCDIGSSTCAQCGLRGNLCCLSLTPCTDGSCQFGTCS